MRKCLWVTACAYLVALAFTTPTAPAQADTMAPVATAAPALSVQLRAGFDGYYKAGGWLPIAAVVHNEGPPITGRLQLSATGGGIITGSYSTVAVLPTHSQKLLSFVAPAPSADHQRTVTLTDGDRTVASQSVAVSPLSPQDYLYGVLSSSDRALDGLRGTRPLGGTVAVAHLSLADLPATGPALNDLDALVFEDTPTAALTADQRRTLRDWVSGGGQLVLSGGPGLAQTLAGLEDLMPASATGTTVIDVGAALRPWGQVAADTTAVSLLHPGPGSIVRLEAGGTPMVVDRALGAGWVTMLAMPVDTPALAAAPGAAAIWTHVFSGAHHALNALQSAVSPPAAFGPWRAVYTLPQNVLPPGNLLAWLLVSYVLIVGPISYVVLGRLDRRELLWATIPLVSVLFTSGSYLLARQLKGSDIIVNTVTIVHENGDASATLDGAVGIFSPGRAAYTVDVGGGLGVAPLGSSAAPSNRTPLVAVAAGSVTTLKDIRVEKWSMQAFAVHGAATAPPPLTATLSLTGGSITGSVRNTSGQPLDTVLFVVGNDRATIGRLLPGEQRPVSLTLSGSVAPVGGLVRPPPVAAAAIAPGNQGRQALLTSAVQSGGVDAAPDAGPELLAFSTEPPFPIAVEGHHIQDQHTALHVVPVSVALGSGPVTLPFGFARREVLENSGVSAQSFGPWLPLGATAIFQFCLPDQARSVPWATLHLRLSFATAGRPSPSGTAGAPTLALYNWQAATWDGQPAITNGILSVAQAGRYVDPRGLIRVQISGSNGQQQLQTLDVSLDGVAP